MGAEIDRRAMSALSGGHLAVDFASGAVPALLPFLADHYDLSYTATAGIMLAATVSSSLVQPAFGYWSDRRGALWLLPVGVLLAGLGIASAGLVDRYWRRPDRRLCRRHRDRGVSPRGCEVRRVREREASRERDVAVQRRRQHRLRARADRDHTDRARGSGSTGTLVAALPVLVVGFVLLFSFATSGVSARSVVRRCVTGEIAASDGSADRRDPACGRRPGSG